MRAVQEGRLDPQQEAIVFVRVYEDLAPACFSENILRRFPNHSMVFSLDGVDWCDWGHKVPRGVRSAMPSSCV